MAGILVTKASIVNLIGSRMKKLVITLAILTHSVFVFAGNQRGIDAVRAKNDNVKLYQQPGTSAQVLESLSSTDEVIYVRRYNQHWSIVKVNDKAGYVLTSELVSEKPMGQFSNSRTK
jgi:lipopolysaccharide export system protein LptC